MDFFTNNLKKFELLEIRYRTLCCHPHKFKTVKLCCEVSCIFFFICMLKLCAEIWKFLRMFIRAILTLPPWKTTRKFNEIDGYNIPIKILNLCILKLVWINDSNILTQNLRIFLNLVCSLFIFSSKYNTFTTDWKVG